MIENNVSLPTDWQTLLSGFLRIGDVLIVIVAAFLAYWLRYDTLALPAYYQWAIALGGLLTLNYMHIAGVYRQSNLYSSSLQVLRTSISLGLVMITLLVLSYVTSITDWFGQEWVALWFGLTVVGFVMARGWAGWHRHQLRRQGDLTTNIALIGAHEFGRSILRQLNANQRQDIHIVGVFDEGELPVEIEGAPVLGSVDDLVRLSRSTRIDEIVLATVDRSEEEIDRILAKLRNVPVNTKLCAQSLRFNMPVRGFTAIAGLPLLHVYERPLRGWGGFVKTAEDLVLGGLILLMIWPIMLMIALLIRLDSPGPVLFRQKRYGFNNNEITVFKFRSMRTDQAPDPKVTQARRGDPRITRIGAFLRRTSLDELPQLFNVLKGDMSLVGPRPHAVAHNEQYAGIIDGYLGRHRVKPGITGWAQINGYRGETDTPEKMRMRVQYDLYYIDNWSLIFDLKILFLTIFFGFVSRNAY